MRSGKNQGERPASGAQEADVVMAQAGSKLSQGKSVRQRDAGLRHGATWKYMDPLVWALLPTVSALRALMMLMDAHLGCKESAGLQLQELGAAHAAPLLDRVAAATGYACDSGSQMPLLLKKIPFSLHLQLLRSLSPTVIAFFAHFPIIMSSVCMMIWILASSSWYLRHRDKIVGGSHLLRRVVLVATLAPAFWGVPYAQGKAAGMFMRMWRGPEKRMFGRPAFFQVLTSLNAVSAPAQLLLGPGMLIVDVILSLVLTQRTVLARVCSVAGFGCDSVSLSSMGWQLRMELIMESALSMALSTVLVWLLHRVIIHQMRKEALALELQSLKQQQQQQQEEELDTFIEPTAEGGLRKAAASQFTSSQWTEASGLSTITSSSFAMNSFLSSSSTMKRSVSGAEHTAPTGRRSMNRVVPASRASPLTCDLQPLMYAVRQRAAVKAATGNAGTLEYHAHHRVVHASAKIATQHEEHDTEDAAVLLTSLSVAASNVQPTLGVLSAAWVPGCIQLLASFVAAAEQDVLQRLGAEVVGQGQPADTSSSSSSAGASAAPSRGSSTTDFLLAAGQVLHDSAHSTFEASGREVPPMYTSLAAAGFGPAAGEENDTQATWTVPSTPCLAIGSDRPTLHDPDRIRIKLSLVCRCVRCVPKVGSVSAVSGKLVGALANAATCLAAQQEVRTIALLDPTATLAEPHGRTTTTVVLDSHTELIHEDAAPGSHIPAVAHAYMDVPMQRLRPGMLSCMVLTSRAAQYEDELVPKADEPVRMLATVLLPTYDGVGADAMCGPELRGLWARTLTALAVGQGPAAEDVIARASAWAKHMQPLLHDMAALGLGPVGEHVAQVWADAGVGLMQFLADQQLAGLLTHSMTAFMLTSMEHGIAVVAGADAPMDLSSVPGMVEQLMDAAAAARPVSEAPSSTVDSSHVAAPSTVGVSFTGLSSPAADTGCKKAAANAPHEGAAAAGEGVEQEVGAKNADREEVPVEPQQLCSQLLALVRSSLLGFEPLSAQLDVGGQGAGAGDQKEMCLVSELSTSSLESDKQADGVVKLQLNGKTSSVHSLAVPTEAFKHAAPGSEAHYLATKTIWMVENFDLQMGLPLRLSLAFMMVVGLGGRASQAQWALVMRSTLAIHALYLWPYVVMHVCGPRKRQVCTAHRENLMLMMLGVRSVIITVALLATTEHSQTVMASHFWPMQKGNDIIMWGLLCPLILQLRATWHVSLLRTLFTLVPGCVHLTQAGLRSAPAALLRLLGITALEQVTTTVVDLVWRAWYLRAHGQRAPQVPHA